MSPTCVSRTDVRSSSKWLRSLVGIAVLLLVGLFVQLRTVRPAYGMTPNEATIGAAALEATAFASGGTVLSLVTDAASEDDGKKAEKPSDVFMNLYGHVLPHELGRLPIGRKLEFPYYDTTFFQLIAIVLMFLVFSAVRRGLEGGGRLGPITRVFSGWVMYIRDDMVVPLLGKEDGKKYLPYFLFVFFFIAFMNLGGLVPKGRTPTACIFVTGALALTTFTAMVAGGMMAQGPLTFWKNLVPHGLPGWLVPLMFVVELIGLLVKPFALMIRLFANLMGGHLVVLSFLGLIFYFAYSIGSGAYAVAVPAVGLSVFIMIIEGFVALLQAYIFTYLSILFVGMCRHPDH